MKTSEVIPLGPACGAEVRGITITAEIDDADIGVVRDALHEHGVIVLRGQSLTPDEQVAFVRRFGPLKVLTYGSNLPGYPEVSVISNIKKDGKYIGTYDGGIYWHTDGSYIPKPHRASFLFSHHVPRVDGVALGDTLFASSFKALETLPQRLKEQIDGKHVVNSLANRYERKALENGRAPSDVHLAQKAQYPPAHHPIARPHPVTGRLCLYVNEGYSESIAEMPRDEGRALLDELFAHMTQPALQYRHHWTEGDLVIWDNCLVIHKATFDYPPDTPRLMYRVMVAGE